MPLGIPSDGRRPVRSFEDQGGNMTVRIPQRGASSSSSWLCTLLQIHIWWPSHPANSKFLFLQEQITKDIITLIKPIKNPFKTLWYKMANRFYHFPHNTNWNRVIRLEEFHLRTTPFRFLLWGEILKFLFVAGWVIPSTPTSIRGGWRRFTLWACVCSHYTLTQLRFLSSSWFFFQLDLLWAHPTWLLNQWLQFHKA